MGWEATRRSASDLSRIFAEDGCTDFPAVSRDVGGNMAAGDRDAGHAPLTLR
jgi:hypothetical protein